MITRKLAELGCNIALAPESIHTQGDTVYDFFNVTAADGVTPLTAQQKIRVTKELELLLRNPLITRDNFRMEPDVFATWFLTEGTKAVPFSLEGELHRELLGGPAHSVQVGTLTADVARVRSLSLIHI